MKVCIRTYGCQMNERDSEAMAGMLVAAGYEMTEIEEEADVLLYNTCSVRDQAERKAIGKVGYVKKLKMQKPDLIIGIAGCMAQRLGNDLFEKLPHLDFVLGTGQLHTLVPLLEEIRKNRHSVASVAASNDVLTGMDSHWNAPGTDGIFGSIAITRGCNRFCSYCIVPYVRGREISRDHSDIVAEAKRLVDNGTREILLLGQNVAAYGWGGKVTPPPDEISPFADLIEELDAIPGLLRLRFTSPYPTYFNKHLIEVLARSRTVCHCFHLPLQSGSDRVLQLMNRQYTAQRYREIVANIRTAMPDAAFTTDVIVGFPGETEEDFNLTRDLMNEVDYDNSYIFKYSPRPGAKSASGPDSVPQSVKEERNAILLDDLKTRVSARLQSEVGLVREVLVEGESARNKERWSGRTTTSRLIHFLPDATVKRGELRQVRILRANPVSLFGELL